MLNIALKEWKIVCDLLLEGRLALLLRKGGISESGGPGVFELEHQRFGLYPSFEHQRPELVKPAYRDRVQRLAEPKHVTFNGFAEVVTIWQVAGRARFDQLNDLHCWSAAQIDMRFNYKSERPLYLVALRTYRLRDPKTVETHVDYTGCRSWVPLRLEDTIDDSGATSVVDDTEFGQIIGRVNSVYGPASSTK